MDIGQLLNGLSIERKTGSGNVKELNIFQFLTELENASVSPRLSIHKGTFLVPGSLIGQSNWLFLPLFSETRGMSRVSDLFGMSPGTFSEDGSHIGKVPTYPPPSISRGMKRYL